MNNAEAQELLKQARYLDNLLSLSKAHHSGRIVQGKFEEKNSDISVASGGELAAHAWSFSYADQYTCEFFEISTESISMRSGFKSRHLFKPIWKLILVKIISIKQQK